MAEDVLRDWWEILPRVSQLSSTYASRDQGTARGCFAVVSRLGGDGALDMEETGGMLLADGTRSPASNRLRWSRSAGGIALAHLRAGSPTPLLVFGADGTCLAPHRCGDDTYEARCELIPGGFRLYWEIRGPRKADRLVQEYREAPLRDDGPLLPDAPG